MTDEVAGLLKRTRVERGLSIDAVGHDTQIPVHYLRLLEGDGDPRILADVLYLIPFLRTYSTFLDLDSADIIGQFLAHLPRGDIHEKQDSAAISHADRIPYWAVSLALLALFLGVVLFLLSRGDPS